MPREYSFCLASARLAVMLTQLIGGFGDEQSRYLPFATLCVLSVTRCGKRTRNGGLRQAAIIHAGPP